MSNRKMMTELIEAVLKEMHKDGDLRLTFTIEQTATLICLNKTKVYEMARAKIIPSIKCGKRILIPVLQLLDWLEKESWA
jgi:excisionase family DNA binding protein